jgi:tetratricopeptide (TPR) repeat protein
MKTLFRLLAAMGLFLASVQTLRIGLADYLSRQDTFESVQHAAQIWPANAEFYVRLADLDAENAIVHLRHAVELDPRLSKSWIALGLQFELQGNPEEGERCYLSAAQIDRQFLPAWTLAGFYVRRSDAVRFWPWARQAAQMSYGDMRPLLRLAFALANSGDMVLAKMIVPRRKVEHEFLQYLLDQNMDASAVADRILNKAAGEDLTPLMYWMNRLIETGKVTEARRLWDSLSDKRLISYPRLTHLTNANFSHVPLPAGGFDWRITPPPGVDLERTADGLRVQFSGRQQESFQLLSQYLDVTGGRYRLSFEYRTVDMRATTNLRWRVGEMSSSPLAAAENWTRGSMVFYASPVNRLTLLEQRDAGTTRPEGIFYLRGLALTRYD